MLAKIACLSRAVKFSDVNLLNSGVVIYLSWLWSVFFFSNSLICVIIRFLNKLLTLGILFSTAVRALIVARLVILGISPLTSFILELRVVLVAKSVILDISPLTSFILALREALVATLVISDISSSMFITLALYTSFLNTSFFYYMA